MEHHDLLDEARAAASAAYAPYSGFGVGAAVLTNDGRTFTGTNVENAAFASTLCAEAVAIASAVAAGCRQIERIAVAAADGGPCPPCGNCRQIMNEFGVHHIVLEDATGEAEAHALEAMLPEAFGPEAVRRGQAQ
ncbi:MAG: cytidine deaminase [Acidimicrobiia bacterium]|nr:MAG: cytidine deaminase [Acidimicrobiia bacterium]